MMDIRSRNLEVVKKRQQMYQVGLRETVQRKIKMETSLQKGFAMSDMDLEIMIQGLRLNLIKFENGEIVALSKSTKFTQ